MAGENFSEDHLLPYLEAQRLPFKAALVELVRIPSVCHAEEGGFPFGEAIDRALRKALQTASDLGFKTKYGDGGYYGFAETGEGEELVGILGHLDVMPPGNLNDWDHDPFDPIESDGMLYGRGTQDDKGPMLAALFGVKALLDAGVKFNRRIRFIFGTDEETLWRCITRYKEIEEWPTLGYSPDGRFPLIYAEKGVLHCHLECRNESGVLLNGGSVFNAVPDRMLYSAERQAELSKKLDELGFAWNPTADGIEVIGKAAHAMEPEKGVNAITRLCIALQAIGSESHAINFIAGEIGEDPYSTGIFGECADEVSGRLKLNVGKLDLGEVERISIDCRIPVTVPKEEITTRLSAAVAKYGLNYKEFSWLAPIYLPRDHFMIETLMKVYRQYSGNLLAEPISSGGATYARAFENFVAFGALSEDELPTQHQPNERTVLNNLYKAMEIYAHTILELGTSHKS